MTEKLVARDGDTLVVTYPEIKLPFEQPKFAMISIAGLTYSRKLLDGDDVQAEYNGIYAFLKENADRDGAEKVKAWYAELNPKPKELAPTAEQLQAVAKVVQSQAPGFNARGPVRPPVPSKPLVAK